MDSIDRTAAIDVVLAKQVITEVLWPRESSDMVYSFDLPKAF